MTAELGPLEGYGGTCTVHRWHAPRVHSTDVHHIVPLAEGGADVPENRREVCPTGHRNLHALLSLTQKAHRAGLEVTWAVRRRYTLEERRLTDIAWAAIRAGRDRP